MVLKWSVLGGKEKETIDKQEVLDDLMEVLDKHLK